MSAQEVSPYRFTVSVEQSQGRMFTWWHVFVNVKDVRMDEYVFHTEAEAREHAVLVLAALHQATLEDDQ